MKMNKKENVQVNSRKITGRSSALETLCPNDFSTSFLYRNLSAILQYTVSAINR